MNEIILSMQQVVVNRGTRKNILNIEDFAVRRGELLAVVGPNGSGKSTLLQAINLLHEYQGRIELFGQDAGCSDATLLRRRSAMVFQEALLLNDTVFNNVACALRFRGVAGDEIKDRVYKALADFRCAHLVDRRARALSGGEAQRVSIARALVTSPDLLLLDEPFASLDAATRIELIEEIRQLAEARGISVLLVSHNFTDVLYFAERAIVVFGGRIVQDDKPEILMRQPVNEHVARLVGMDNIISCHVKRVGEETLVTMLNGVGFLYPGVVTSPEATCCVPGDALHLYEDDRLSKQGSLVIIEGEVERVTPGVGGYRLLVRLGEHLLRARVPRNRMSAVELHKLTRVKLAFDPAEVHMI